MDGNPWSCKRSRIAQRCKPQLSVQGLYSPRVLCRPAHFLPRPIEKLTPIAGLVADDQMTQGERVRLGFVLERMTEGFFFEYTITLAVDGEFLAWQAIVEQTLFCGDL